MSRSALSCREMTCRRSESVAGKVVAPVQQRLRALAGDVPGEPCEKSAAPGRAAG